MPDDATPTATAADRAVGGAPPHPGQALVAVGGAAVRGEGRRAPGRARHHRPDLDRRHRP
ncbi:hypothetical protein UQW22_12565 [Isoptericola halotolerans]|uniref:hypothetical protein n=1 Tax=Isoptericola halotolerans TaxID=300560 RepID=UPI003890B121